MNITKYINNIESIYRVSKPKYMELAKRKDEIKNELMFQLPGDKTLTVIGREEKKQKLNAELSELKSKIDKLNKEAHKQFDDVKADYQRALDIEFKDKFDEIDSKTVELIKSGILKYNELIATAERFNNPILSRFIAEAIEKQYKGDFEKEKAAHVLAYSANSTQMQQMQMQAINAAIEWAGIGVGDKINPFGDFRGAEASYAEKMLTRFDDAIAQIKALPEVKGEE